MIPFLDYANLLDRVAKSFRRAKEPRGASSVRMIALMFARPSAPLARDEIIPQIADWHHRSGDHINFFFAGYEYYHPPGPELVPVPVPGGLDWLYSPEKFNECRIELESRTRWKYSGGCDLLLTNARSEPPYDTVSLDFSSTVVCQLEKMKEDEAIKGVERFFESIFRFAEKGSGVDPTWGFSDNRGAHLAGTALRRVLLSLLPKEIGKDIQRATHFAVIDVGSA